jgi:hypothetical protein
MSALPNQELKHGQTVYAVKINVLFLIALSLVIAIT